MHSPVDLSALAGVHYSMTYHDLDMYSPTNTNVQHTHTEYEIYVNISGAVSFVCGDNIYPVGPGNAVINRPGEPHHCVYRENLSHKHYWMLFTCPPTEPLLGIFHDRPPGMGNLITLTREQSDELIALCALLSAETSPGTLSTIHHFTRLLMLLNSGTAGPSSVIPVGIRDALTCISANLSSPISVRALAETAHMSLSTFERRFREHVGMTPKQYITQRKLVLAAEMLAHGASVSEASEACGFPDYSHFIALFGRRFGMTPLAYRRATTSSP